MLLKHSLLVFFVFSGALACSEKPKVDLTADPQSTAGSLAKPVEVSSAEPVKVDRSPIPVREGGGKLALSATKLQSELVEERAAFLAEERILRLHPLRNRMVVTYAGFVAVLEDHRLELARHITPQEAYEFTSVVGTWPEAVVAEVQFDSSMSITFMRQEPIKETRHYRWTGADWLPLSYAATMKAAAWRDGGLLTLADLLKRSAFAPNGKLATEEGANAMPSQATPRDPERCKEAPAEVKAEELDALPSGEAFVLGKRCGGGGYAMERWAAGKTESAIDDMPDAPSNAKRAFISAGAPDRAHVVLSTGDHVYAARWDGQALRKLELKDEGDVRSIWTAADGALFFVLQPKSAAAKKTKAELVRVLPSGEVSRSPAFALSPSVKVWAADAQTAYVASFSSILSTKPGLVFTKGKLEEPAPPPFPPRSATALPAFTDACPTPLIFLYDVSAKSPAGYDFPTTRKALSTFAGASDIALIEFVHAGQRKLGIRIPAAEVGRKVIAHIVANMKGERPELVCFAPTEGVRSIALN